MGIIKSIFRTIIGFILGVASGLALSPAVAAFSGGPNDHSSAALWIVILVGAALGFFAPTIRRAFGRGFLLLGASIFALPLSVMLLSGRTISDVAQQTAGTDQAAGVLGAGIAGTILTGASAFVGFILGGIFLIIGLVLVLGGRREVVIANQ